MICVDERYGILWVNGDMSIESFPGHGEDDGTGGMITTFSVIL